jgi:putative glutamine amidotransferase
MDADLPVLAICRGSQVLNVAAGGSLIQDIPSAMTTELPHSVDVPKDCVAHEVRVTQGSRLHEVLGSAVDAACACRVNSRHHQSVARIGGRLVATAIASDGVIEGIEAPAARFCVGVQWHPENFWRSGEFRALFDAFVGAARERLAARGSGGDGDSGEQKSNNGQHGVTD